MRMFSLVVAAIVMSGTTAFANAETRAALESTKQKYTTCLEILDTDGDTPAYRGCLSEFAAMLEDYYYLAAAAGGENPIETAKDLKKASDEMIEQATADMEKCQETSTSDAEFEICRQDVLVQLETAGSLLDEAKALLNEAVYDWRVRDEGFSPIDDSQTLSLIRQSHTKNTCQWGDGGSFVLMRCVEGKMQVYFDLNGCIFSDVDTTYANGLLRVGSDQAEDVELAGDRNIFAIKDYSLNIPLITRMFGEERLVFRAQPFSAPQQTIVFDISGLEEAITPLRDACGW